VVLYRPDPTFPGDDAAAGAPSGKRVFDVAAALVLLALAAPLMAAVAVAVKLDSPGPVLFRQERRGRGGPFPMLKFRTMHVDAERRLADVLAADPALALEYGTYHKLARDPRATRTGRALRRMSLDELPQLWNVLAGDMSLVGPRPYMPHELADHPREREVLSRVRPGITGLWQVSGRHRTTFGERLAIDVRYAETRSAWLDLCILARTVWAVIRAGGA
jgi:lipopolysaccharide/colanic/teichoic acid biosynthesis glycosyltransferase